MSPQDIWQKQSQDAPRVTLEYVRHRAEDFDRRNRDKARRHLVLGSCASLYVLWAFWTSPRYASELFLRTVITLSIVVGWVGLASRRGKANPASVHAPTGVLDSLQHYRGELVRHRDAYANSWRALLLVKAVLVPALVSACLAKMHYSWRLVGVVGVLTVVSLLCSLLVNTRNKRRLQREIDAVDLLRAQ